MQNNSHNHVFKDLKTDDPKWRKKNVERWNDVKKRNRKELADQSLVGTEGPPRVKDALGQVRTKTDDEHPIITIKDIIQAAEDEDESEAPPEFMEMEEEDDPKVTSEEEALGM